MVPDFWVDYACTEEQGFISARPCEYLVRHPYGVNEGCIFMSISEVLIVLLVAGNMRLMRLKRNMVTGARYALSLVAP